MEIPVSGIGSSLFQDRLPESFKDGLLIFSGDTGFFHAMLPSSS
jgi:hypothetical protein